MMLFFKWHVCAVAAAQSSSSSSSWNIVRAASGCRCFMWYVQKVMQFINRNAYIMVAVKGTGYCTSAGRAIKLIVNNALRLVAVNIIVDVVVW